MDRNVLPPQSAGRNFFIWPLQNMYTKDGHTQDKLTCSSLCANMILIFSVANQNDSSDYYFTMVEQFTKTLVVYHTGISLLFKANNSYNVASKIRMLLKKKQKHGGCDSNQKLKVPYYHELHHTLWYRKRGMCRKRGFGCAALRLCVGYEERLDT